LEPAARTSSHPSLWRRTTHDVTDWFGADALAEAKAYATPLNRLSLIRSIVSVTIALAIVTLEIGPWATGLVDGGWVLQLLAVLVVLSLIELVWSPWFDAWIELDYDKRHDLSTQTAGGFVADLAKGTVLSVLLPFVLMTPLYAVMRNVDDWWLAGWAIATTLVVVLAFLYPVVIMPRFNKFEPLEAGDLRDRIDVVATRAGEEISGTFTMDASRRTKRDNAFVAGFGPTKRVVIYDTMLDHPTALIEQVVAHEIGHYRLKHIPKTAAFQAIVFLGVFAFLGWWTSWSTGLDWAGVSDIGDPGSLPYLLVGFGIAAKATSYAQAFYSRSKERQADLEALELLGDPDAFIDVWRRMAPKNKAELEPSFKKRLEASHPAIAERMAFGKAWAAMNPDVQPVT
jgi:STE24 endopeptidase